MTMEELDTKLRAIVASVVGLDEGEEGNPEEMMAELRDESIEILELAFQCEKEFGVKLEFQKLFDDEDVKTGEGGIVTPESLDTLRSRYPYFDFDLLGPNPTIDNMRSLLTYLALLRITGAALSGSPDVRAIATVC